MAGFLGRTRPLWSWLVMDGHSRRTVGCVMGARNGVLRVVGKSADPGPGCPGPAAHKSVVLGGLPVIGGTQHIKRHSAPAGGSPGPPKSAIQLHASASEAADLDVHPPLQHVILLNPRPTWWHWTCLVRTAPLHLAWQCICCRAGATRTAPAGGATCASRHPCAACPDIVAGGSELGKGTLRQIPPQGEAGGRSQTGAARRR